MATGRAGALETLEYKILFESPRSDVGEPIAGHVREVLAMCQAANVQRSSLKSFLAALDILVKREEDAVQRLPMRDYVSRCKYCDSRNTLIVRDYLCVCEACGYENDNCMVQDGIDHLPPTKATCGSVKEAERMDAAYIGMETTIQSVERELRKVTDAGFLNRAQELRAGYLATVYVLEHRVVVRKRHTEIAAACGVFVLLETWASFLVPVQIVEKGTWITKWVLAPMASSIKKQFIP